MLGKRRSQPNGGSAVQPNDRYSRRRLSRDSGDASRQNASERRDRRGGTYVIEAMRAEGIDVTQNIRTQLTQSMLDNYDAIINMAQPEYTPAWLSEHPRYTYWAIDDPRDDGEETAFRVKEAIKTKLKELIGQPKQT